MRKNVLIFVCAFFLLISCNRRESNPSYLSESPSAPIQKTERPGVERPSDVPDLSSAQIVVPEMVKGKWKAVKLMVEDKKTNQISEHTVNLGEEWRLPDSNIKVKIGEFLPDLIIQGTVFTSVTNELKNPAVRVTISENGKELFKGWLFSLFPTMHPFQHERFAITLKDVVAS